MNVCKIFKISQVVLNFIISLVDLIIEALCFTEDTKMGEKERERDR